VTETITLTGGSGFIGRRFADHARKRGYRIRQLSRHPPSHFSPDDEVRPFHLEDTDTDLNPCAALVHLAAYIPRHHNDPAEATRCLTINALGTLHLLEAASRAGISRIVQTTSANAYAPSASNPNENAAMFPNSRGYYLGSKIVQEIYATEFCRSNGQRLTTLRLASVYGPGQTSGALANMVQSARTGHPILVSNGGRFGSDMVYVDDVAAALTLAIERDFCGPINIGSGERTTIATLANMIAERVGVEVVQGPTQDNQDDGFPALDTRRLLSLGQRPTPLATGLDAVMEISGRERTSCPPNVFSF
jgi:UDP-glucose 4-epimerase